MLFRFDGTFFFFFLLLLSFFILLGHFWILKVVISWLIIRGLCSIISVSAMRAILWEVQLRNGFSVDTCDWSCGMHRLTLTLIIRVYHSRLVIVLILLLYFLNLVFCRFLNDSLKVEPAIWRDCFM